MRQVDPKVHALLSPMQESAMLTDSERRGLCVNCKNAPDCTYPRSPERPVIRCEEYDCDAAPLGKTVDADASWRIYSE